MFKKDNSKKDNSNIVNLNISSEKMHQALKVMEVMKMSYFVIAESKDMNKQTIFKALGWCYKPLFPLNMFPFLKISLYTQPKKEKVKLTKGPMKPLTNF